MQKRGRATRLCGGRQEHSNKQRQPHGDETDLSSVTACLHQRGAGRGCATARRAVQKGMGRRRAPSSLAGRTGCVGASLRLGLLHCRECEVPLDIAWQARVKPEFRTLVSAVAAVWPVMRLVARSCSTGWWPDGLTLVHKRAQTLARGFGVAATRCSTSARPPLPPPPLARATAGAQKGRYSSSKVRTSMGFRVTSSSPLWQPPAEADVASAAGSAAGRQACALAVLARNPGACQLTRYSRRPASTATPTHCGSR